MKKGKGAPSGHILISILEKEIRRVFRVMVKTGIGRGSAKADEYL
jgi:hypothetical protein